MTESEELELLRKQYAALKEQRDHYKYMLVDLIDDIYSGYFNHFNLPDEDLKDEDGHVVSFTDGMDKFIHVLRTGRYFHLWRLLEHVRDYHLELKNKPNKAELEVLLEKWKLPQEIDEYRKSHLKDDAEHKGSIRELAIKLIAFAHDFDFHKSYPGDEPDIYAEAFTFMVREAMRLGGIPATPEGIEEAMKELYANSKK